jgi:exodeoxyribonuclease X
MKIRVLDLKTTGFDPHRHAPCEVGYADLIDGRAFEIGQRGSFLCDPGHSIPPKASAKHHIVDDDVEGLMMWPEMLDSIVPPVQSGADFFAAHGADFARKWITDDLAEGRPWICTYRCAVRLWPEAPAYNLQTLRYWLKLGVAREVADRPRAGSVAETAAYLLRKMLTLAPLEELVRWTADPALHVFCQTEGWRGWRWSRIGDAKFLKRIANDDSADKDVRFTASHYLAIATGASA